MYSNALTTHCGAYKELQIKQIPQANSAVEKMAIAYNNDPKIKQDVDSWTLKSNKLTANMGYAIQLKAANPSLTFSDNYHFDTFKNITGTLEILGLSPWNDFHIFESINAWTDEQGHVFIFFPIKSLAETMHKSEMSVKTALNALEKENLIARKRQGAGFPNRIYVKYPPEALNQTDRIFSVKQTENCPTDGQKTVSVTDRKLSSSNKEKNNIKRTNSESKDDRTAYGSYQNVFLSTEELKALKDEVPHYQEYIEKLSSYMASSGKQYSSHAATIRS